MTARHAGRNAWNVLARYSHQYLRRYVFRVARSLPKASYLAYELELRETDDYGER